MFNYDDFNEAYEHTEYDSPEDIAKCLNCKKDDCDNCLKYITGV